MNELIADALVKTQKEWEVEVEALNKKIFSNPAEDFFAVHKEFKELLDSGESRLTKEFDKKISDLSAREKKAKRAMNNYCNTEKNDKMMSRIAHLITCFIGTMTQKRGGKRILIKYWKQNSKFVTAKYQLSRVQCKENI